MKTFFVFGVFLVSLILLAFVSQNAKAFPGAAMEEIGKAYVVQEGDTLYSLAGELLNDPELWEKIYQDNPFLNEKGRRWEAEGKVFVLIRPGEKLRGLKELGVVPSIVLTPFRFSEPIQPENSTITLLPLDSSKNSSWWIWLMIILSGLGLVVVGCVLARSLFRDATANPVTSGPPAAQGGILPNETERIRDRFLEIARVDFQRQNPGINIPSLEQFQIQGEPDAGRVYGLASVCYGDGSERVKRFEGETAYRANILYPDGRTEEHIFLAACANDLRRGIRYVPGAGFRFEPTGIVTENGVAPIVQGPETEVVMDSASSPDFITVTMGNDRVELKIGNHRVVVVN